MSKLTEADILESIFAIIIGSVVSKGRADKSDVNAARAIIEPTLFSSGKYEGIITKDAKREKGSSPPDIFNVSLSISTRPQRTQQKNRILYNSASEIGNLNDKINELIVLSSPFKMPQVARILKARDEYLNNSKEEGITFAITADGATGDDVVNGSITVSMQAQVAEEEPESVLTETLTFTLRTSQEDPKNIETYNTMVSIAEALELKWKNIADYNDIKKKAVTGAEKQKRGQILRDMCDDLLKMIAQNKVDASRRIYEFLRLADSLVDYVSPQARKQLEEIEELQRTTVLYASSSGRNINIRDTKKNKIYFTLKTVPKSGEIEFRLE
jgi:hypothetical protein